MTIDADNSKLYSNGQIGWNVQANTLYADFHGEEALFGAGESRDATNNGVEQSTSQPPCIRLPEDNKTRRLTNVSELPEGLFHAAFGVPRMRASVCSVVNNRTRCSH